jgi:hypothetical protein
MKTHQGSDSGTQRSVADLRKLPDRLRRQVIVVLLLVHTALLAYSAHKNSWTWDEVSFLPAGISHWKFGDFELFDVNPPLVRMVAALPVLFADPKLDWEGYTTNPTVRPERDIGSRFLTNNGERSFWLLTLARFACIPFSLLGGFVCYRWSRELFGDGPSLLSLFLWTFSPTIIAHGQLITADVGGASIGILCFYMFWKWLHESSWRCTLWLGTVLGLLQLTKSTWVILFGVWPLMWLIWRFCTSKNQKQGWFLCEGRKLAVTFLLAVYLLNLGYGFQGTGKRLGDYEFISTAIGGPQLPGDEKRGQILGYPGYFQGSIRNRFTGTMLGSLPVPLPQKYVEGIDRQKFHFECDNWSYLGGQWKKGGWRYYYVYAISVKSPHGTWMIILAAGLGVLTTARLRGRLRDEAFLAGTMILLFTFVSLQTGINRHVRYALPAFPFAFILASRAGLLFERKSWRLAGVVGVGACWLVFSTLTTFPHHLSYFNELAGGPKNGGRHLNSSNVDWGQDLLYLKEWLDQHPNVKLDGLAWHCRAVDPAIAGIEAAEVPHSLTPGWYAVSMNMITNRGGEYEYFKNLTPIAWAGHSIPIFCVTEADGQNLNTIHPVAETRLRSGSVPLFAAYSELYKSLVTGSNRGSVSLHNPETLTLLSEAPLSGGRALSGSYSADGQRLAVGWTDGTVRFYEDLNSDPISVSAAVGSLQTVELSGDGQVLAIAGSSGLVELRSTASLQEVFARIQHDLPALSIGLTNDGTRIATGTGDSQSGRKGCIQVWDTATGSLIQRLRHSDSIVKALSISADGQLITGRGEGDSIQLWDTAKGERLQILPDSDQVMLVQFSADGRHIFGGDFNGLFKTWEVGSRQLVLSRRAHKGKITGGCLIRNTSSYATIGADGMLKLWDISPILGATSIHGNVPQVVHTATSANPDLDNERSGQ